MGAKEEVLRIIEGLPDDCSTDDILDALFSKKQVDAGLMDVAEGRVVSRDELKARIAKWRSSAGRQPASMTSSR
jgi:methionine synthase II (cobalamin-independent)